MKNFKIQISAAVLSIMILAVVMPTAAYAQSRDSYEPATYTSTGVTEDGHIYTEVTTVTISQNHLSRAMEIFVDRKRSIEFATEAEAKACQHPSTIFWQEDVGGATPGTGTLSLYYKYIGYPAGMITNYSSTGCYSGYLTFQP